MLRPKKKRRSEAAAPSKPVIAVSPGDIAIVKISKGSDDEGEVKYRKLAIKVYSVKGGEVTGADLNALNKSEEWEIDDDKLTRVPEDQVILNLGTNPEEGSVYGCKILLRHGQSVEPWGPVFNYIDGITDEQMKGIHTGTKKVYELYKGLGLDGIFPLRIELHPVKGKYDGDYTTVNLAKEPMDKVRYRPKEPQNVNYIMHLAAHEFAHGLQNRLMTDEFHVEWIKLYHAHLVEGVATTKQLSKLYRNVAKKGSFELARASLSEDEEAQLDAVLAYIHENHYLDFERIERMLAGGVDIQPLWPTTELPVNYMESPIGEYSQKNPAEFFCESVRLYLMKEKLPKQIQKLVERTFTAMRGKSFDRNPED